ncbi:lipopolysaccharide biosynthesis protein [Photobacterium kagoshimensis]|uniref:lipopolysaccharide biosynthesis protein n=1 Tax=Photobacterium kagoshimensis TaxID=2910242 RepID=UPI003D0AA0A9
MNAPLTVLIYGIALITSKLIGLLLQPWVTQWLGTTEYGRLDVLITLITCLSLIVTFGIPDALCRFAHDSTIKREALLGGALTVLLLICGGASFLFISNITTIQQWLPGSPPLLSLYCLMANLCLNAVCTVPLTKLRLAHQPKQFVSALLLFSFSQAILIVLLAPRYGINGIMVAGLIGQLGQFLYLSPHLPIPKFYQLDRLIRYGRAITLAGLLAFITLGIERWAIADMLSLADLATYAIAMQWAMAASLLLEPFGLWWFPKRFSFINNSTGIAHAALVSISACQLSSLIAAGVITIGPLFLTYWLPSDFHASADILPILAAMMMLKQASTYLNMGCYQQEDGRSVLMINVISAIVAVAIIFSVLPIWGLSGLLAGGASLQLLRLVLFYTWSQRLLPLPYPNARLLISYLLIILLLIAHYWGAFSIKCLITLTLFTSVIWPWRIMLWQQTQTMRRLWL